MSLEKLHQELAPHHSQHPPTTSTFSSGHHVSINSTPPLKTCKQEWLIYACGHAAPGRTIEWCNDCPVDKKTGKTDPTDCATFTYKTVEKRKNCGGKRCKKDKKRGECVVLWGGFGMGRERGMVGGEM
jgi:hypothetical protein